MCDPTLRAGTGVVSLAGAAGVTTASAVVPPPLSSARRVTVADEDDADESEAPTVAPAAPSDG